MTQPAEPGLTTDELLEFCLSLAARGDDIVYVSADTRCAERRADAVASMCKAKGYAVTRSIDRTVFIKGGGDLWFASAGADADITLLELPARVVIDPGVPALHARTWRMAAVRAGNPYGVLNLGGVDA